MTLAAQTFANLPAEIKNKIVTHVSDLSTHVALSQVDSHFRKLYLEKDWESLLQQSGFGRALLYKDQKFVAVAAAVMNHPLKCNVCAEYMKQAHSTVAGTDVLVAAVKPGVLTPEDLQNMKQTEMKDPKFALHKMLVGRRNFNVDLNWFDQTVDNRPLIGHHFFETFYRTVDGKKLGEGDEITFNHPASQLHKHVTIANALITRTPIESLLTVTISDVPFGCDPEAWSQRESILNVMLGGPAFYCGDSTILEELSPEELELLDGPSEIDHRVTNDSGLTCLDVLRAAADVPAPPMASCGESLIFQQAELELDCGALLFHSER